MKLGKQSVCLGIVLVALAACGAQDPQAAKANSTRALGRRIAEIAGQANGAAPAEIDSDTRLDGAKAGPGLILTTTYTLVNAPADGMNAAKFEAKLAPVIRKGGCENPDLRPLINQGVVVVLEYRGNDGNPIGTVSVNRAACVAPK